MREIIRDELRQMQSLPLEAKVKKTILRIREWYEYYDGNVYTSVSGIDSTVLKHIVDSVYKDVPSVFVNTGLEYPELQQFWRKVKKGKYNKFFNDDVTIIRPKMRFDEVIKKYGYPVLSKEVSNNIYYGRKALERGDMPKYERYVDGKRINKETGEIYYYMGLSKLARKVFESDIPVSNLCCDVMKKDPAKKYEKKTGRKAFIGTQTEESKMRENYWLKNGCNAFNKERPTSQPLSFWTKQDILRYAKENKLPYPSVYGKIKEVDGRLITTGCQRTGCMFCMFGAHLEKEPNRFQMMKETHPKQWNCCINDLGCGKVLDFMGVKYE